MSSGNKFHQQEATKEECLADLDKKFEIIRQRIQVYDKICNEQLILQARLESLESKPEEIIERLKKSEMLIEDISKIISSKNYNLTHSISSLEQKIACLEFANDQNSKCYETIHASFINSLNVADEKAKSYSLGKAESQDLLEYQKAVEQIIKNDQTLSASHTYEMDQIKQSIAKIEEFLNSKVNDILENSKAIHSITIYINKFEAKMRSQIDSYIDDSKREQESVHNKLKVYMKEAEERVLGTPNSNAALEARILNRLEISSLDASNAVMMCKNSEEKMRILDKKIQTINLLLEKLELKS